MDGIGANAKTNEIWASYGPPTQLPQSKTRLSQLPKVLLAHPQVFGNATSISLLRKKTRKSGTDKPWHHRIRTQFGQNMPMKI